MSAVATLMKWRHDVSKALCETDQTDRWSVGTDRWSHLLVMVIPPDKCYRRLRRPAGTQRFIGGRDEPPAGDTPLDPRPCRRCPGTPCGRCLTPPPVTCLSRCWCGRGSRTAPRLTTYPLRSHTDTADSRSSHLHDAIRLYTPCMIWLRLSDMTCQKRHSSNTLVKYSELMSSKNQRKWRINHPDSKLSVLLWRCWSDDRMASALAKSAAAIQGFSIVARPDLKYLPPLVR